MTAFYYPPHIELGPVLVTLSNGDKRPRVSVETGGYPSGSFQFEDVAELDSLIDGLKQARAGLAEALDRWDARQMPLAPVYAMAGPEPAGEPVIEAVIGEPTCDARDDRWVCTRHELHPADVHAAFAADGSVAHQWDASPRWLRSDEGTSAWKDADAWLGGVVAVGSRCLCTREADTCLHSPRWGDWDVCEPCGNAQIRVLHGVTALAELRGHEHAAVIKQAISSMELDAMIGSDGELKVRERDER